MGVGKSCVGEGPALRGVGDDKVAEKEVIEKAIFRKDFAKRGGFVS